MPEHRANKGGRLWRPVLGEKIVPRKHRQSNFSMRQIVFFSLNPRCVLSEPTVCPPLNFSPYNTQNNYVYLFREISGAEVFFGGVMVIDILYLSSRSCTRKEAKEGRDKGSKDKETECVGVKKKKYEICCT